MLIRILGILILFSSVVYGADDPDIKFYVFDNFSHGMNSHGTETIIGKEYCHNAENIRFNKKYGSFGQRTIMRQKYDFGSTPIKSGHRFYKSDGTEATVISTSTLLRASTSGSDVFTIGTGYADSNRWSFITYKDKMMGLNGSDQPIKWDGKDDITADTDGNRTAENLVAELGSCFADLNTGTDLDASSWYQYKVAFYDGSNYWYSEALSNAIQTGSTVYNIELTDIPIGPEGTTKRYLYRTSGQATKSALASATYYMCYEIADNETLTQADSISDAILEGDRVPTWSTASSGVSVTPPICKYGIIHDNRLFSAGKSSASSDLFYSDEFNPDFFYADDVWHVREDDGDVITGLSELMGLLNIYKTNSIQKLYTDTASELNWTLGNTYSEIGLSAPFSLTTTPLGDIYLNREGLYAFNGQSTRLISDAITDKIEDINQVDLGEVAGHFFNNEYHLSYRSIETGARANDRILVYDIIRDAYSLDTKEIDCFISFNSGTDQGILYLGSSSADGIVWANETSTPVLSKRYKSELDAGTFDDTSSFGEEDDSYIELAWDCDIDGWLTELQTKDASISTLDDIGTYLPNAIINRPDTDGTWISPVYQINAGALTSLYWNERLYDVGDITWSIRLGETTTACTSASWSGTYTDPTGSDISAVSGNIYIQLRASLSTSDITITPQLYLEDGYIFKVVYTAIASTKEGDVLSKWESGWNNLGVPGFKKRPERMRVFYRGTEGTINVRYRDDINVIDNTFTIDLTILPTDDPNDEYEGTVDNKIYSENLTYSGIRGTSFKFYTTHEGITDYNIDGIEIARSWDQSEDL